MVKQHSSLWSGISLSCQVAVVYLQVSESDINGQLRIYLENGDIQFWKAYNIGPGEIFPVAKL